MQIFVILEYQPTLQPPSYQILSRAVWCVCVHLVHCMDYLWKESCLLYEFTLRLQLALCLLLNWLNASQNYNLYEKLIIILGNNVSTLFVIFSTIVYVLTRAIDSNHRNSEQVQSEWIFYSLKIRKRKKKNQKDKRRRTNLSTIKCDL